MSGAVDVMEAVTPQDAERLKKDDRYVLMSKASSRISWIALDVGEEVLTKAVHRFSDLQGQPLKENPFADIRVRRALRLAIDLEAVIRVIYKGDAIATGQYVLPGSSGFNPDMKLWKPDPEKARALLQEAGWHNKFKVTITTYDNSFPEAGKVSEAIAQAWTRIGIPTSVEISPYALWYKMALAREFVLSVTSYANSTGAADQIMVVHLHSNVPNSTANLGNSNRTSFKNPKLDELIGKALRTMDASERDKMWREGQQLAFDSEVRSPLVFVAETVGLRKGLTFVQRSDRHIYAMNVRPAAAR
jgi:peptide/nickel transport system substrate-binding protein